MSEEETIQPNPETLPVEAHIEPVQNTPELAPERTPVEPISEPVQTIEPEPVVPIETVPEPQTVSEPPTAQTPVFEPLTVTHEPLTSSKPAQKDLWRRFLDKVNFSKRKKLDRIMTLFNSKTKITNDEVEKLLHVSDATATRYLSILEKENKITQSAKSGHSVSYTKIQN